MLTMGCKPVPLPEELLMDSVHASVLTDSGCFGLQGDQV